MRGCGVQEAGPKITPSSGAKSCPVSMNAGKCLCSVLPYAATGADCAHGPSDFIYDTMAIISHLVLIDLAWILV